METYLNLAEVITAVVLVVVILLQAKGGALGGIFGGWGTPSYRSRRGIEQTLFRFTIVLVVLFLIISILSVRLR